MRAHRELRGEALLPIHWATFDLAFHEWADPVEGVVREAAVAGVQLALPAPGGRFEPGSRPRSGQGNGRGKELPVEPWWRASV